ncbi:DUF3667 domain-containing protein [Parapedomonas caeni]
MHRPIWELAEDFLHSVVHFDGRVPTTLRSIACRPGAMTVDWLAGRQQRYVPPIRLFIFTSLLLVILLAISDVALVRLSGRMEAGPALADQPAAARPAALVVGEGHLTFDVTPGAVAIDVLTVAPPGDKAGPVIDRRDLDQALDAAADSGDAAGQRSITRLVDGINALARDPRLANALVGKSLSRFMLLAVPLMALLLWLAQRRRYLVEHLLFALNVHTAFFIGLTLMVLVAWVSRGLIPGGWLLGVLWLAYSAHFLLALKRVYGQGWLATAVKSILVTGLYFSGLLVTVVVLLVRSMAAA